MADRRVDLPNSFDSARTLSPSLKPDRTIGSVNLRKCSRRSDRIFTEPPSPGAYGGRRVSAALRPPAPVPGWNCPVQALRGGLQLLAQNRHGPWLRGLLSMALRTTDPLRASGSGARFPGQSECCVQTAHGPTDRACPPRGARAARGSSRCDVRESETPVLKRPRPS